MSLSKKEKMAGIVLAAMLLVVTISSTYYFLIQMGTGVGRWIVMNSCAPASILYLVCFFVFLCDNRRGAWLIFTFLPIYFLGTLAMFFLSWKDTPVMAHAGHIVMTFNIGWAAYVLLRHRQYKALATGLLAGILVFSPYIGYVQSSAAKYASEAAYRNQAAE